MGTGSTPPHLLPHPRLMVAAVVDPLSLAVMVCLGQTVVAVAAAAVAVMVDHVTAAVDQVQRQQQRHHQNKQTNTQCLRLELDRVHALGSTSCAR
jgi:ABC-type transporter MlaC component